MKKKITKYTLIAFLGLTGIIACGDDEPAVNNGTDDKATLHLDKSSLNFDETTENTTKELNFIVTNKGNDVLKITSASLIGTNKAEFTTNASAKNIDAGKSETFKVTFKPTSVGDKTASLELKTNVGDKTLTLTGKGKNNPLLEKDGFLFSYEFENNLDTTNGDVTGVTLTKDGNRGVYIPGITRNSNALDINETTLIANNISLPNSMTQTSISFWYKSTSTNRFTLLDLKCGNEKMRVVKDLTKHFIDGKVKLSNLTTLNLNDTYNNSNLTVGKTGWNHVFVSISYPNTLTNPNKFLQLSLYVNGVIQPRQKRWKESQVTLFNNSNKINLTINKEKADLQIDNLRIYSKGSTVSESTDFFNELDL